MVQEYIKPSYRFKEINRYMKELPLDVKEQIAAEIIAYTNNSIGQYIYDANFALDTPTVFAWASVIVSFSISLEAICKKALGRIKNVD